jgi:N-acetylglucosamine kinase-like BadF-type ATPase
MIVIADSGSTKTQWRIIKSGTLTAEFDSQGLNPYFCKAEDYKRALNDNFPKDFHSEDVNKVFFYGAGCSNTDRIELVTKSIVDYFRNAEVEVNTDILAAARALFGQSEGIAIILGSGTNLGYYNGSTLEQRTLSLGYILGDEGSGAYLGKMLISQWLNNDLPSELTGEMQAFCKLSVGEILTKVYSEPFPNRFLASFVPFLEANSYHPFVKILLSEAFEKLVSSHVMKYPNIGQVPVGVVGSVGSIFHNILSEVLAKHGVKAARFVRYPIDDLVIFHSHQG